ncbi:MAG: Uncharacterized protein K0S53_1918 [Bacteroidetes bacterium]|jgi:hypothetical protein|nr:Uncharacterized protein [Bacteroidota bacterium]
MEFSESNINPGLHTDKLTQKYGGFKISIILQEGFLRISEIRDLDNTLRTFAISTFTNSEYSEKLRNVHEKILTGLPIGETLRKNGFNVIKKILAEFTIEIPKLFNSEPGVLITTGQLSEISCKDEIKEEFYVTVCEINCPTFLKLSDKHTYENQAISEKVYTHLKYAALDNYKFNLIK